MYEVRVTRQFIRATRKTARVDMEAARDAIIEGPYDPRNSHTLSHDWAGFRAWEFDRRDRIIYRVCEECVQKNQCDLHPLACCEESEARRPLQVITLVDFGDYHASTGGRRLRPARFYDIE